MQITDDMAEQVQDFQRTANETMTRVILVETERVDEVTSTKMLIVEPLAVGIVVNA